MDVGGHQRYPKEINELIFLLGQSVDSLNEAAADLPQVTCTAYSWKYSAIVCLAGVITAVISSLRGNTSEVKAEAPACMEEEARSRMESLEHCF